MQHVYLYTCSILGVMNDTEISGEIDLEQLVHFNGEPHRKSWTRVDQFMPWNGS